MEYYQKMKMKTVADVLRDVGHAVLDFQLILNHLCGVNPRFTAMADDLANSMVFQTFTRARDLLALKELRLANKAKLVTNTALLADARHSCNSLGGCHSSSSAIQGGSSNINGGSGSRGGGATLITVEAVA